MSIQFTAPLQLPVGTPSHIVARCEVLSSGTLVGFFEKHDFRPGTFPSSGKMALDLEELPPSQCYAFRDLRGETQIAAREREHLLQRLREWLGIG